MAGTVPGYHAALPPLGQQLPAGGGGLVADTSQYSQRDRDGDLGSSEKEGESQGADKHLLEQAEGMVAAHLIWKRPTIS